MTVVAPGDPIEARAATIALAGTSGPALSATKAGEPLLHRQEIDFRLGHAIQLQDGKDITLISTGGMLGTAIEAAQGLGSKGYSVRLLSMPTLAPLDTEAIRRAVMETNGILTIEEHSIDGLGTMTAEALAEMTTRAPFHAMRLVCKPVKVAGSQTQLREAQGLSVECITAAAEKLVLVTRMACNF